MKSEHTNTIFETLSAINVNEHTKKKGQFTYLSWSWAWEQLMMHYPDASYEFLPLITYPDGTCEASVNVTVDGVIRNMMLPVMDFKNNAKKNPDAREISDTRMRCLVKCIAMFGLGIYLYSGESLPEQSKEIIKDCASQIFACSENNDSEGVSQLWHELDRAEQEQVWMAIPNDIKYNVKKLLEEKANA